MSDQVKFDGLPAGTHTWFRLHGNASRKIRVEPGQVVNVEQIPEDELQSFLDRKMCSRVVPATDGHAEHPEDRPRRSGTRRKRNGNG